MLFKRLITFTLAFLIFLGTYQLGFAQTPPDQWSPYLGESDIYKTADGAHWSNQDMYWRSGSKVEFDAMNDTYEHQTVFYNYDNDAWALEDAGYYQTDLPDPYLDT